MMILICLGYWHSPGKRASTNFTQNSTTATTGKGLISRITQAQLWVGNGVWVLYVSLIMTTFFKGIIYDSLKPF